MAEVFRDDFDVFLSGWTLIGDGSAGTSGGELQLDNIPGFSTSIEIDSTSTFSGRLLFAVEAKTDHPEIFRIGLKGPTSWLYFQGSSISGLGGVALSAGVSGGASDNVLVSTIDVTQYHIYEFVINEEGICSLYADGVLVARCTTVLPQEDYKIVLRADVYGSNGNLRAKYVVIQDEFYVGGLYFDDFEGVEIDSSKWTVVNYDGYVEVYQGILYMESDLGGNMVQITSKTGHAMPVNFVFRMSTYYPNTFRIGFDGEGASVYLQGSAISDTENMVFLCVVSGVGSDMQNVTVNTHEFHVYRFNVDSGGVVKLYIDDVLTITGSLTLPSGTRKPSIRIVPSIEAMADIYVDYVDMAMPSGNITVENETLGVLSGPGDTLLIKAFNYVTGGILAGPAESFTEKIVDLISLYKVRSITVKRSIFEQVWQAEAIIAGKATFPSERKVVIKLPDENGTMHVVFVGVVFTRNTSYEDARDETTISCYDLGYYLTRQKVPAGLLYRSAYYEPSETVTAFLGGSKWYETTGIEPYKIKTYWSYDPNELQWGDISRPWKWAPKSTKRDAIQEMADYQSYMFESRWRDIGGGQYNAAGYFVHVNAIDDPVDGLDLPAPVTFTSPDKYVMAPFVLEERYEEEYNVVTVEGFDVDGVLHSSTYKKATVLSGQERPLEYYEEGSGFDTDLKCQLRASDLFYYYMYTPKIYNGKVHSRPDLQLYQKVYLVGYEGVPETAMRVIGITYTMDETQLVTVELELIDAYTFTKLDILKRAANPRWDRETTIMISRALEGLPQVEAGTVTSVNGNAVVYDNERGQSVDGRLKQ